MTTKRIGILGGMAPESTLEYYRILIELSHERLEQDEYPEIIIYSLNFRDFRRLIEKRDYNSVIDLLAAGLEALKQAGADFALLASNTPHLFFAELSQRVDLPLLSIVEATLQRAVELNLHKLGLFGTKFTMDSEFYRSAAQHYKIELAVPGADERELIHKIIMGELVNGQLDPDSQRQLVAIAQKLKAEKGIEGLILGCTELPLILDEQVLQMPALNTTRIHAEAAFARAMS